MYIEGRGTNNRKTTKQICLMLEGDKCNRGGKMSEEENKESQVAGLDTFCEADHNDI